MRRLDVVRTVAALVAVGVLLLPGAVIAQSARPTLVMISIDGLRPDYVTAADAHALKIPNLRRFLKDGAFADGVTGVIPTVTYPSHTTLITGVWPARHGILGNATFDPLRQNQGGWYWYAEDIKVPTLWQAATHAGHVVGSISWPVTAGAPGIAFNIPEYWRAQTAEDLKLLRLISTPGLVAEFEKTVGEYTVNLDAAEA